jgi:hypothetical protein
VALKVDAIDVSPNDLTLLLANAHELAHLRNGWINLRPLTPDEHDDQPITEFAPTPPDAPIGVFARFKRVIPVEGTWVPGKIGRRGPEDTSVGLVHPAGRFAVRQLRDAGHPVPADWRVVTDHLKRGLVLSVPDPGESIDAQSALAERILDWLMGAATALAPQQMTGLWRATVYRR